MLSIKNPLRPGGGSVALCLALIGLTGCAPSGPRALQSGVRFLHQGDYARAIDKLKVASELLPQHAQVWNHLGLAYHGARQTENAVFAYQKALDLNRDLAAARFNLGNIYLEQNNLRAAINELTIYTALQPMSLEGWLQLGTAQLRDRQWDAAEKSFSNALQLRKDYPPALNGIGLVQVQKRRPREAANFFNAAAQTPPHGYPPALLNLAILSQQQLNNKAFALKKYQEYASLKPRPANWQAVDALAHQLDQELNPPKVPLASVPPPQTASVATQLPPPSISVINAPPNLLTNQPPRVAATTSPPVLTATSRAPVVLTSPPISAPSNPPVVVANLPEEPPIKTAQDPKRELLRPQPPPAVTQTNVEETNALAGGSSKGRKPNVLDRVNPLNWRGGKPPGSPRVTPLPSGAGATSVVANLPPTGAPPPRNDGLLASATIPPARQPAPAPVIPPPVYPRFAYKHPKKPLPGNRQQAERFFAEAATAQRERRLSRAMELYRLAIRTDPAYFEAYYNLGLAGFQAGDSGTALLNYELALAIDPSSADTRYNFALALQKAGYPRDAADELTRLSARGPSDTRVYLTLANLYARELAQPELARELYIKVLGAEPRHPEAPAIRYWLANHPG